MKYFSERQVMKELRNYPKSAFKQEEVTIGNDGYIFYSFTFTHKGVKGYITARYNPDENRYKSIDMNCNFCKTAGYNNYSELRGVMDYIRHLFRE